MVTGDWPGVVVGCWVVGDTEASGELGTLVVMASKGFSVHMLSVNVMSSIAISLLIFFPLTPSNTIYKYL